MHNDIAERVHEARVALCYNCNNIAFDYIECNQINVLRDGGASEVIHKPDGSLYRVMGL